jgi:hypothetical protein
MKTFSKSIINGQVQRAERSESLIFPYKTLIVFLSFMGKLVNQKSKQRNKSLQCVPKCTYLGSAIRFKVKMETYSLE